MGLLDFARQAEYQFETADINDSIKQALNLVSYQLTLAKIAVRVNLSDELPEIDASWEHLQSVWLNLLLNARDALQELSSPGYIEIISRHDEAKQEILVIVRDNGRGMSASEMTHLFEPFYTTKAPGQGTGLGLATCQQIIKQHGGSIEKQPVCPARALPSWSACQ